jgi:hypothetical protein
VLQDGDYRFDHAFIDFDTLESSLKGNEDLAFIKENCHPFKILDYLGPDTLLSLPR